MEKTYLCHWGIKGQKWGIRRYQNPDGTLTAEGKERYSLDQYRRDRGVYGTSGATRIQKRVYNDGESVSGARSLEAERAASYGQSAKNARMVAGTVGSVGGAVAGLYAYNKFAKPFVEKTIGRDYAMIANTVGYSAASRVGASLGRQLVGGAAGAVVMASGGYSPSKKWRYT